MAIQIQYTPPCNMCGNRLPINYNDESPAMVGLVKFGETINICRDCLIKIGKGVAGEDNE